MTLVVVVPKDFPFKAAKKKKNNIALHIKNRAASASPVFLLFYRLSYGYLISYLTGLLIKLYYKLYYKFSYQLSDSFIL